MNRALAALSLLLAACPAAAIEKRKTVYPDGMMGFERHVRAAIREARLNVSVLDESIQPEYRMFLDPKFKSAHAEILYRKVSGRSENAVLELYDVRGKDVIVRYSFKLTADEAEQRRAAREFVTQMRDRLHLKLPPSSPPAAELPTGANQ